MAIIQVPDASRLVLILDDGTDDEGNPRTKTKSFNNVKPDASDEALGRAVAAFPRGRSRRARRRARDARLAAKVRGSGHVLRRHGFETC